MGWALSSSGWSFYFFRGSKESLLTNPQAAVGLHRHEQRTGAAVGKDRLAHFEREFAPLYSKRGCPSIPIRLMAGCLMQILFGAPSCQRCALKILY